MSWLPIPIRGKALQPRRPRPPSGSCPGLPEPMSRSELAAADQCLKFCDNKPSAATLPMLNNLQDLDSDCSAASFLIQGTQAHWNAGRPTRQCGVNGVQALSPAGPRSRYLRCGKLPAIKPCSSTFSQ